MIAFGMLTFVWDRQVSVQMVIGGVALISIILTAYTASATFEDVKVLYNACVDITAQYPEMIGYQKIMEKLLPVIDDAEQGYIDVDLTETN